MDIPLQAVIRGTGAYVPARVLTNHDLERLVDTSDEWILARSGIRERRLAADDEQTSDLACRAARRALEMAELKPADIDLVIVGTATPDMPFPSTACLLLDKLGHAGAAAFDLAAGCSGFLYGLGAATDMIRAGSARTALVVGAEILSRIIDWQDRGTCVLFGDGAGAVVLQGERNNTGRGILSNHLHGDGGFGSLLALRGGGSRYPASHATVDRRLHYVAMQGNELFKVAVRCLTETAREAMSHNNITADDIDLFIPHQANMRIIRAVAGRCGIPMERVFTNLEHYGNTSAASIPIALDEALRGDRIRSGDLILLDAFGAGLTWGSSLIRW
ncbi:MAG: ketoacyl-ACP synthase III [Deltaproteobacteria bacterium]|nr:ketoacyl-ACP synthase III [Candidatus Anaeroferrophillacea bacterium]